MKPLCKYICTSLLLLAGSTLSAQTMRDITTDNELLRYGGQQTFSMSPDGRYVTGAAFNWSGFIYDTKDNVNVEFDEGAGASYTDSSMQLLDVNNLGMAVGFDDNGGILVDAKGTYSVFAVPDKAFPMAMPHGINGDGSIIVGSIATPGWEQHACYWENGNRVILPSPTEEETGFRVNGSCAMAVS